MALKRYNGTAWVVITAADIGAEPAFSKNTAFNRNFGNIVNTVCEGNDPRLSVYNLGTFVSENALIQYILTNQLSSGLYKIGVGTATGDSMLSLTERETYYEAFIFAPQGVAKSVRITKAGEVIYYVSINLKELVEQSQLNSAMDTTLKVYTSTSAITTTAIAAKAMLFCTEAQFTAFQTSSPTIANAVKLVFTT